MKRKLALGAVVAAVAMMASLDTVRADSCRSFGGRSFGYSNSYRPSYSYGFRNNYYRPSYNYGYNNYYRPSYGFGYSRPGFSITFGSGRSGFGYGRSFGNRGYSHRGHRH